MENKSEKEDADIVKAFQEGGKLDANTDKLNFEQAFSHYRGKLGPGQRFMWKGRPYSTNTQEEVLEMQDGGKLPAFMQDMSKDDMIKVIREITRGDSREMMGPAIGDKSYNKKEKPGSDSSLYPF